MNNLVYTLIIFVPILLFSMAVHESMHALASYLLGDDTAREGGRISLNPLRHIDPVFTLALPIFLALVGGPIFAAAKPVEINMMRVKWREFGGAIIAAVGPLSNLLIALLAAGLIRTLNPSSGELVGDILALTVALNVGLFIFNSIPWPPLDGSRVLYAFAPRPVQEFMDTIERFGLMGLVIFMLIFFQFLSPILSNLILKLTNGLLG